VAATGRGEPPVGCAELGGEACAALSFVQPGGGGVMAVGLNTGADVGAVVVGVLPLVAALAIRRAVLATLDAPALPPEVRLQPGHRAARLAEVVQTAR